MLTPTTFLPILQEKLQRYHTPAAAIAVLNDGVIDWAYTGTQDGQTLPQDTLFQAGSISKEIFALAVLRLYEEGRIDLDRDVNEYLTGFIVTDASGRPVRRTVRQLISHTGGLTVHGFEGYPVGSTLPTTEQILAGLWPANSPKVYAEDEPDQHFRYSGGGTTILQKIVVDLLQQDLPSIMDSYVLKPLGMTHSTYRQPLPPALREKAAMGHPFNGQVLPTGFHVYPEMTAAGLWTTAADLLEYGHHLQQIWQGEEGVIRRETLRLMVTPVIPEWFKSEDRVAQAGLGCFLKGSGQARRFGHSGSNEGYVALMNFYLEKPQGIAIMLNSNEGSPLLYELQNIITKAYGWEIEDADRPL